jgi:hypothetical protein
MNLLLEGDDLEALLIRARREGGAQARIVRAQKVRRGGILGFFAREGFEVAVEIPQEEEPADTVAAAFAAGPDPAGPPGPDPARIGAADLLSLIERASAVERAGLGGPDAAAESGITARTSAAEVAAAAAVVRKAAYDAAVKADTVLILPDDPDRDQHRDPRRGPRSRGTVRRPASPPGATDLDDPMVAVALAVAQIQQEDADRAEAEAKAEAEVAEAGVVAEFHPLHFRPVVIAERASLNTDGRTADHFTVTELPLQRRTSARVRTDVRSATPELSLFPDAGLWFNSPAATISLPADADADGLVVRPTFTALVDQLHAQAPSPAADSADSAVPADSQAPAGSGTPATWAPRASTVVPQSRPRRKHRAEPPTTTGGSGPGLPQPRPAKDDYWAARADEPATPAAATTRMITPTRESVEVADARTAPEAAWQLLRGWRSGSRTLLRPDDATDPHSSTDAGHWHYLPRLAPQPQPGQESGWTRLPGSFTDAATTGAVPAGAAAIDSGDRSADRAALRALGVPAEWTEQLAAGDRFTAISEMLERLPKPSIRPDAAVIAVIGAAEVAGLEAHRTALDLPAQGRPRAVTLVPGQTRIDRRTAIARSKRLRPVVICVPVEDGDDPQETRKALANVKAESVIAVVDASRPLEETRRWIEALGQVDAISLVGALEATSPAAVLGLGLPVIRVDGVPVDRIGWAALLCTQLATLDDAL